jgi:VIT1/CCC1 family predicted Fe2+/Mn2+ transporter
MTISSVEKPQVIYLIERIPAPVQPAPEWIDRVKHAAGVALVITGLSLLFGASLALAGYFTGLIVVASKAIHPFFMTGIACSIAGFHLAKGGNTPPSIEITAGPLAVTL